MGRDVLADLRRGYGGTAPTNGTGHAPAAEDGEGSEREQRVDEEPRRKLVLTRASAITPRPVRWTWSVGPFFCV